MSFLDPTPGQMLDRKAVLRLKIDFGRRQGANVVHWQQEALEITGRLEAWGKGRGHQASPEQLQALEEIHARMWHHVGWIEGTKAVTEGLALSIAQIAVDLQKLNRQRYDLIREIDLAHGIETGKEKL